MSISRSTRPSQDIKAWRLLSDILRFDVVALRFEARDKPLAYIVLVSSDGLDLRQVLVELNQVVR